MECCHESNHHEKEHHKNHKEHHYHERHQWHHEGHHHHSPEEFLQKFWVSAIGTLLVLVLPRVPSLTPFSPFITLLISVFIFFYGGLVFFKGATKELRDRSPGMMTLISLGIGTAFLWSFVATFYDKRALWWELNSLIAVMLLGHYLEMKAVSETTKALEELARLLPSTAHRIKPSGEIEDVPLSELKKGDVVLIKPGEAVPADGKIIEGKTEVIEALITGESLPIFKKEGDNLIAGTQNTNGVVKMVVEKTGEETFVAKIRDLVSKAQTEKTRFREIADRLAGKLVYVAVTSGAITFLSWLIFSSKGLAFAIERTVTVLVIACPHALGLAVPLVSSLSSYLGALHGILIRRKRAFEVAQKVTVVLFDKTGTLTEGKFEVVEVQSFGVGREEVLRIGGTLEKGSEHPLAKGILKRIEEENITLGEAENLQRIGGKGIVGEINKEVYFAGNFFLAQEMGIENLESLKKEIEAKEEGLGATSILIGKEKNLLGVIFLRDKIRKGSKEAIEKLHKMGIKTAMITGDTETVAKVVAKELGLSEYYARVLPEQKHKKVKELQEKGEVVAMVGDGINDAPALTASDLGIAIGTGTNIAIESADVLLVSSDPRGVPKVIELSRATYRKMVENLFWATSYNAIAIPLAGGILAFQGILLSPAMGAVFMSLSTIIVAVNALSLKRLRL